MPTMRWATRSSRSVWISGSDTTTVTKQVYDGQTLLMDLDGSGTLQIRYFAGNGPDQWVARQDGGGTTAYYLSDNLASIIGIVSASGSLVDVNSYDAFGNVTGQSDAALAGNIGYAGMYIDPTTGFSRTPEPRLRSGDGTLDSVGPQWLQRG